MSAPTWICCICGEDFTGWGNNPDPVIATFDTQTGKEILDTNGNLLQCCNACDADHVLPARLAEVFGTDPDE